MFLGARRALASGAGVDTPTAEFDFSLGLMDPRITYTHTNANRWGFDSSGLLVNFATTVPNFDYGPMGGGALRGLFVDAGGAFSLLQNRDGSNAAWTKTNVTASKNAVGIDGAANSATTLTATGANGKCTQSVTLTSSLKSFAAYVKRKTGTGRVWLTMDDGTGTSEITSQINSSTFSRVYMTQTVTNPVAGFIIETSSDEIIFDCAAIDLTCGNIPTTPMITAGSAVTRVRDDVTVTGTNFSDWFSATAGTFLVENYIDYASDASSTSRRALLQIDDTTANNRITLFAANSSTSNNIHGEVFTSSASQASINSGVKQSAGILQRTAFAYAANDFQIAWNGSASSVDSSVSLPTVSRMVIGGRVGSGEHLIGAIVRVRYWNRRRSQTELQSITAL